MNHLDGFNALLGHRIAEWGPDKVIVELDIEAQHLNFTGTVHGGVLVDVLSGFSIGPTTLHDGPS